MCGIFSLFPNRSMQLVSRREILSEKNCMKMIHFLKMQNNFTVSETSTFPSSSVFIPTVEMFLGENDG